MPGLDSKQLEQKAAVGRSRQQQETQYWVQIDTQGSWHNHTATFFSGELTHFQASPVLPQMANPRPSLEKDNLMAAAICFGLFSSSIKLYLLGQVSK